MTSKKEKGATLQQELDKDNKELQKSELLYRVIFENTNDAICLVQDSTIINCNAQTNILFRTKKENLIGTSLFSFSPEFQLDGITSGSKAKQKESLCLHGIPQQFEWVFKRFDQTEIHTEVSLNLIEYEEYKYIQIIIRDISERKKADQALIESETRLRNLIHALPDLIWLKDKQGVYLQCNKRFESFVGINENDLIGKTDYDFFDKELADFFILNDQNAIKAGKPTINEEEIVFVDGHKEILETIKTPISDSNGNVNGVLGIGRDITNRKKVEQEISESKAKLLSVIESTNDLIWAVDAKDFKIIMFNTALKNYINNLNVEIAIGKTAYDLLPLNRANQWTEFYQQTLKNGTSEIEYESFGENLILQLSFNLIVRNNEVFGISVFGKDITEKKQSEKALRLSEEKFSKAFNLSPLAICISIKETGVIIECNNVFSKLFGFPKCDIILNNSFELGIWESEWERNNYLKILDQYGSISNMEQSFITKNKSKIITYFSSELIEYNNNQCILSIFEDITEKRTTERMILNAKLHAEEEERRYFATELHDGIGPLLSTIRLYIQWLSKPKMKASKTKILEQADQTIQETINAVKEISQKITPAILKNLGINYAINSFIDKLSETKDIDIKFESNIQTRFEELIEITIYRLICECLNNTIKHAHAKNVAISLSHSDNQITIIYIDNGIGFNVNEKLAHNKGLGIYNMNNRIKTIGGTFEIQSNSGEGVKIIATIVL